MNKDAEEKEEEEEEGRGIRLLGELVSILDRDPLINEVGFVHPSQLATFHPLGGEDQIASFSGTVQKSTVGTRNISFSGTSKFPLSVEGDTKASRELSYDRSVFWNGDHKLAISVQALFPLYMTAKSAYLSAYQWYKRLVGSSQNEYHLPYVCEPEGSSETSEEDRHPLDIEGVENELMNHSKVLVLLNCDYASAWNSRKQVISRKPLKEVYCTELRLSALVISYAPKSEQAWSYRYWLIKLIISGVLNSKEVHLILESESDFVENIVERSHMNYRAWRHRCWLVNHMSKPQVLNELRRTHEWAESHVGDNCCFHYCRLLLLKLHQSSHHIGEVDRDISLNFFYTSFQNDTKGYEGELLLLSKEELDWNKNLITHNSGRETLWIHRRFLFLEMIQQAEVGFHCNHTLSATHCDIGVLKHGKSHQSVPFDLFLLMEQEFEFINSCINKHGTIFEDASKQKEYAAMYNMWIIFHLRQVNGSQAFIERVEKEKIKLKVLLENVCPQRTLLWEEVLSV